MSHYFEDFGVGHLSESGGRTITEADIVNFAGLSGDFIELHMNEEYARQIARDWNVPASGAGYVVRFALRKQFADRYAVQTVGGSVHKELWVPAEELAEMNGNIVGLIEVIAEFKAEAEQRE